MRSGLRFEPMKLRAGNFGTESSVPSFLGNVTFQNEVSFHLDEWDEIFEAYGRCASCYPYKEMSTYNRELHDITTHVAILENDYLKAVFLPEFGGRLWSLRDKKADRALIYTNDVLRYSNLAVRNAWFSGGVEWNIGIIGHTPMTTEQLHTAELVNDDGVSVLRMYGYERIRGLEYQMDFWLGDEDRFLNCRMRVVNTSKEVVPMYWWSNMAVPEYQGGRIVVPAAEAFTCGYVGENNEVYKTAVPMVKGIDISRYQDIPYQVDYFFNIAKDSPKYISNLDSDGYGLLHMSTDRLRGRKLFSWGNNDGSACWQEFLTEEAGRYVEIQAGLAQTQYGCLPLAPHTAWEWIEQYGAVQTDPSYISGEFEELRAWMTGHVKEQMEHTRIKELLSETQKMAHTEAKVVYYGKSYGTLKNKIRKMEGDRPLSEHLDYGELEGPRKEWMDFLKSGIFITRDVSEAPEDYQCDELFYQKLKDVISNPENADNWYAHYQLGVMCFYRGHRKAAKREMLISLEKKENPWAYHILAVLALAEGDAESVKKWMWEGLNKKLDDLSYVKEGLRILLMAESYGQVIAIYDKLEPSMQNESRVCFDYLIALGNTGEEEKAFQLLNQGEGLVLDDIREGLDTLSDLYVSLYEKIYHEKPAAIPRQFNFHSLEPVDLAK